MRVASVIMVNTPKRLLLLYHFVLALLAGFLYRFPSRAMTVIGVTGTNGKSTVVEMLRHIFEEDSRRVASISSIRFQIGKHEWRNDLKMTMPGRFFLQRFLADARKAKCSLVILEVTSEGIAQFRHRFIAFDAAVLTNLTPEHIESHGSFKKYREAKAQLFRRTPVHILNGDDKNIDYFSNIAAKKRVVYREKDFPSNMALHLPGRFNSRNAVAAVKTSALFGVDEKTAYRALGRIKSIPGRLERIAKHPFTVYVDYAHTPDALMQVYKTLRPPGGSGESHGFICVLGSAGGGRHSASIDRSKRKGCGYYYRQGFRTVDDGCARRENSVG